MTSLVGIPLRMPASSLGKKRLVGLAILVIILSVFFSLNRFPKLDTVREDLEAVTGPKIECFQGFCIEREDDSTLLERWWKFSLTLRVLIRSTILFQLFKFPHIFYLTPTKVSTFMNLVAIFTRLMNSFDRNSANFLNSRSSCPPPPWRGFLREWEDFCCHYPTSLEFLQVFPPCSKNLSIKGGILGF